jgi:hypothetical protein
MSPRANHVLLGTDSVPSSHVLWPVYLTPSAQPPQIVLLVDMVALLMYNFSGMMVTGHLGAVFRTVLETMRTLFVWLIDIILFYSLSGALGESWDWLYGSIQLAGFVALVAGTLVYGRGDDEAAKQELKEAMLAESGNGPAVLDAEDGTLFTGQSTAAVPMIGSSAQASAPLVIGGGRSVPIATPSAVGSFRASMAINSFGGSYSRSMGRMTGRYNSRLAADEDDM